MIVEPIRPAPGDPMTHRTLPSFFDDQRGYCCPRTASRLEVDRAAFDGFALEVAEFIIQEITIHHVPGAKKTGYGLCPGHGITGLVDNRKMSGRRRDILDLAFDNGFSPLLQHHVDVACAVFIGTGITNPLRYTRVPDQRLWTDRSASCAAVHNLY